MSWSCRSLHLVPLVVALTLAACQPEEDKDREPIEGGPETCLTKALECSPFASCKYGADQKPYCECNPGFEGDGVTCLEVDECEDPSPCSPNATCLRVENATDVCICNEGFVDEPTGDDYRWGTNCVDINECGSELLNDCDPRAVCHNTPGSYECACNGDLGYTEDQDPLTPPGTVCVDLDECAQNLHNCDPKATCTNTEGGFTCACDPSRGYGEDSDPETAPGTVCVDLDECLLGTHNCDPRATCTNTPGAFTCACDPSTGYGEDSNPTTPPGTVCVDLDECLLGTHDCATGASCTNTQGGFTCACDPLLGYREDDDPSTPRGTVCVDIDECATGANNCDEHATCTNTPGGFTCACDPAQGYREDSNPATPPGTVCVDVNECELGTDNCDEHAACTNTPGGFTCACDPSTGYAEDTDPATPPGTVCVDIDECASGLDNCDEHAICTNTPGGFTCACDPAQGYAEDTNPATPAGTVCVDVNECELGTDNCDEHATCTNTPGGFTCACNPATGYGEDADPATPPGTACVDIDECTEGTHDCGVHASCANTVGGFTCACDAGWTTAPGSPEGRSCVNVDECAAGTHACDPDATCDDTDGDYTCTCNAWFVARNAPGDDPNRPVCVPSAPLGAGNGNGCLIRPEDGSVWCWGYDTAGAVGLGTPRRMGGDTGFVQLSQDGTCGFKRDGSLWCWTTGISTTDGGLLVDWRRIGLAGGWREPVRGWATRAPGTLWRWDATAAVPGVPEMYGTETDWLDFCPGTALTGETVYCGIKVGPPTSTVCWSDAPAADRIQVGTGFVSLSCQGSLTCGVKEDGSAACWTPVLVPPSSPDGDYVLTAQPYAVRAGFDIAHALVVDDLVEITVGGDFVCAIREDGGLYCAGRFGTSLPMVGDLLPDSEPWLVRLGNDPGWRSVVGGADHACAIRDNRVYCWGANGLGQLGGLAPADTLVPTEVIFPAMLP